ncbi:MAG: EamA family transporter [Clostridia bacterium]
MSLLYAIVTSVILFGQGVGYKIYGVKGLPYGKSNDYLFNSINFAVGVIVAGLLALTETFDIVSILYGLGSGAIFCVMILCYNKALKVGNIAFVNFIMALAFFIPLIGSVVFLGETISVLAYVGIALSIVASYIVCYGQGRGKKVSKDLAKAKSTPQAVSLVESTMEITQTEVKPEISNIQDSQTEVKPEISNIQDSQTEVKPEITSVEDAQSATVKSQSAKDKAKKNLIYAIILITGAVFNGFLSLYVKLTYKAYPSMQQLQFLLGTFLLSFIAMLVVSCITTKGFTLAKQFIPNKWFFICSIGVGIVTVFGNCCFQIFSVKADASIFYPITSAIPMFLAAIISPLFKEKLSKLTLLGIGIGILAIVLVNF